MANYKGYPAYPEFAHFLEPMFENTDSARKHMCRLCAPECYATLVPGYVTCARCGVVILTGRDDDPMNEALDVCEGCAAEILEELNG